ncbi:MAG: signal peptidase I [Bdellovibrionales bacterium]
MSKKTSFRKSFGLFSLACLWILGLRWIGFEPFVIPSGSMIPTLLINDHIVVSKYTYGIRLPFSNIWLKKPRVPNRGDIVVFQSTEKEDYYLIKRVVGLPGDRVQFTDSGELIINGETAPRKKAENLNHWNETDLGDKLANFDLYNEKLGERTHEVLLEKKGFRYAEPGHIVPPGKIFLMGDSRDRSRDSRFWGDLPLENLWGKAQYVWLSCEKTLSNVNFICDPKTIRWNRFFHKID